MQSTELLTGPVTFDQQGYRENYTIDIYRVANNLPIAKVILLLQFLLQKIMFKLTL